MYVCLYLCIMKIVWNTVYTDCAKDYIPSAIPSAMISNRTYWIFKYNGSRAVAEQPQEYQQQQRTTARASQREVTEVEPTHKQKVRNSVRCSIAAVFIITPLVSLSPITHCVGLVLVLFPPSRAVLRCETILISFVFLYFLLFYSVVTFLFLSMLLGYGDGRHALHPACMVEKYGGLFCCCCCGRPPVTG